MNNKNLTAWQKGDKKNEKNREGGRGNRYKRD